MKKIFILLFFSIFYNCQFQSTNQDVTGDWYRNGIKISISSDRIVFEDNPDDFLIYSLNEDNTIVTLTTEIGNTWNGKIISISKEEIVYYDSAYQKK